MGEHIQPPGFSWFPLCMSFGVLITKVWMEKDCKDDFVVNILWPHYRWVFKIVSNNVAHGKRSSVCWMRTERFSESCWGRIRCNPLHIPVTSTPLGHKEPHCGAPCLLWHLAFFSTFNCFHAPPPPLHQETCHIKTPDSLEVLFQLPLRLK